MEQQELLIRLTELGERAAGNARRIEALERGQEALNRLASAVEVLASKQTAMGDSLERMTGKIESLEQRPARRWESLADKVLLALAGAFAAFLLSRGGAL